MHNEIHKAAQYVSILFIVLLSPCIVAGQETSTYTITGHIKGAEGKTLYLSASTYVANAQKVKKDSAKVLEDRFFKLEGPLSYPGIYSIFLNGYNSFQTFYLDTTPVVFDGTADSLYLSSVRGSQEQEICFTFDWKDNAIQELLEKESHNIQQKANNKDTTGIGEMYYRINSLKKERSALIHDYIQQYPKSYNTLRLITIFKGNLISYDRAFTYFEQLPPAFNNNPVYISTKEFLVNQKRTVPGSLLAQIALKDTSHTSVSINNIIKANTYTVIDFWASWCIPCRKNNAKLSQLHKTYKKDLAVISISGDTESDLWKNAVKMDNMDWINLSDMKGVNEGVFKQLAIKTYPTYFLVDTANKIIIRGEGTSALTEITDFLIQHIDVHPNDQ